MALSHFCLHFDMQETMAELSDEEAGRVIKALLAYCNGLEPEPLTGAARIVYGILRRQHDRDVDQYAAKAARLSANGSLGGRPRKATETNVNQQKPTETNKKQMVFSESKKSQEEEEEEEEEEDKRKSRADSPEPSKASGPPVARIPLNDGTYHVIYQADIDHYRELYPAVDVMAELRKMIGWCEDNKAKRKTKRGVARFIGSWLSREQDRGGRTASAPRGKVTESQYTQRPNTEPDGEDVPQWLRDRLAQNPA